MVAAQDVAILSIAAAADVASTAYAKRICPGCSEGNALMSEPALAIAIKGAAVAGVSAGCGALRAHGHKGLASALRWTVVTVWLGIAIHNVEVARRYR